MKKGIGQILWRDLTVKNAEKIKNFYCEVVGWKAEPHDMGEYNDYNIVSSETGDVLTGICHAKDTNVNIPSQWMMYVNVEDVVKSVEACVQLGGKIVDGPRKMGDSDFCIIQDPEGAVLALLSKKKG